MISLEPAEHSARGRARFDAAEECVVFSLGSETYAVAAVHMRSCLSLPRLTPLDDTPDYLIGAFDLRGELAPVVSLAVLSGKPLKPAGNGDLIIVVDVGENPLAFHADAMLGVEPVRAEPWAKAYNAADAAVLEVVLSGGHAWLVEPTAIHLVAQTARPASGAAEQRLRAFERRLSATALSQLEERAERYRRFARSGRCPRPQLGR
jgi:chemotaxis signal transduction protein